MRKRAPKSSKRRPIQPAALAQPDDPTPEQPPTRAYSKAFTPTGDRHQISIDRIPTPLFNRIKAKSKREGIALRSLILAFLDRWSKS